MAAFSPQARWRPHSAASGGRRLQAMALRAAASRGSATTTATAHTPVPTGVRSTVAVPTARPSATGIPTDTPATQRATVAATGTALPPTATPTPPHTLVPPTATAAAPTSAPTSPLTARITSISFVDDRYAVSFVTDGYVAALPGQHMHFFFNTVPPEPAGSPASGPWIVPAAEPDPFTGYAISDQPSGATQMCILVANPDHSIILNSGNCVGLPSCKQPTYARPALTLGID